VAALDRRERGKKKLVAIQRNAAAESDFLGSSIGSSLGDLEKKDSLSGASEAAQAELEKRLQENLKLSEKTMDVEKCR